MLAELLSSPLDASQIGLQGRSSRFRQRPALFALSWESPHRTFGWNGATTAGRESWMWPSMWNLQSRKPFKRNYSRSISQKSSSVRRSNAAWCSKKPSPRIGQKTGFASYCRTGQPDSPAPFGSL